MRRGTAFCITAMFLLCAMMVASGCIRAGNRALKDETAGSVATKVVKGKTTQDEIKSMFGEPDTVTFTDGGRDVWKYSFEDMSIKFETFIPIVNWFAAGYDGTKKELTVLFDTNKTVQEFRMTEGVAELDTSLFGD